MENVCFMQRNKIENLMVEPLGNPTSWDKPLLGKKVCEAK